MRYLDSISFDDSGYSFQGVLNRARVWRTAAADGIGLFYFDRPPDIAAELNAIDEVRAFYRKTATAAGFRVIEVETCTVDGCVLMQNPFFQVAAATDGHELCRDPSRCHSVTSAISSGIECLERGMTGLREASVIAALLVREN